MFGEFGEQFRDPQPRLSVLLEPEGGGEQLRPAPSLLLGLAGWQIARRRRKRRQEESEVEEENLQGTEGFEDEEETERWAGRLVLPVRS